MGVQIKNFYDLDAWKMAHSIVLEIYEIVKTFPRDELYGIISQLRRSASSITANIAEGFSRYHFKDKIRFYYQSRGSASEVQNFLILSRDLGYINKETCNNLIERLDEVLKLINGLIRSIQNNY